MNKIFLFLFWVSSLFAEDPNRYPHFIGEETTGFVLGGFSGETKGFLLGSALPRFDFLSLRGEYYHQNSESPLFRRYIFNLHPGVFQIGFGGTEGGFSSRSGSFGLRLSDQKTIEIQHSYYPESGKKRVSFHARSGNPFGFAVSFSKLYEGGVQSFEGNLSFHWMLENFDLESSLYLSDEKQISRSRVRTSLLYHSPSPARKTLEIPKIPERIGFYSPSYQHKQPLQRKFFTRLTPYKKKLKPFSGFTLQELLNKRIPIREAMLIVQTGKDREKYEELLLKLPAETRKRCRSLEISKTPGRKK